MIPTPVYDSYWRFAHERLAIYYRRLENTRAPWTGDPILNAYRFTNTYRVADRVSQYLIREIQYGKGRSQAPHELFFRTILFKIFNKIETWERLERAVGPITWRDGILHEIDEALGDLLRGGVRIYSAAYIMPPPALGEKRKHSNHLCLIAKLMDDRAAEQLQRSESLRSAYEYLLKYPGLGKFLAFQFTIDLNYSTLLDFSERDYVVAGPGAIDGIAKCFVDSANLNPENVINAMVERQEREFHRLGLEFPGLFGRPLMPIDCQNIFCEISKYSRVAFPEFTGRAGRSRIKQRYSNVSASKIPAPAFPPKWQISGRR